MNGGSCLLAGICLIVSVQSGHAQTASSSSIAAAQTIPEWSMVAGPVETQASRPSKAGRNFASAGKAAPDTTQSITRRISVEPATRLAPGWNLTASAVSADLVFSMDGVAQPVGFTCKKGEGFVNFKSPPTSSYAPGKRLMVHLKSINGAIRIDTVVSSEMPRSITSEIPVRASSLVFVLTPKKGEPTVTVGGWSAKIPAESSEVKLLRFQSFCEQPLVSSDEE